MIRKDLCLWAHKNGDLLATDPELCEEENVNLQHYLEIFFEDQKSRLNL